jgi:trehalose monomycolate/heme transporter
VQTAPVSLADPPPNGPLGHSPRPPSRFGRLGGWAGHNPRVLVGALLLLIAVSIAVGRGVVGQLASGGFAVEGGEPAQAAARLRAHWGVRSPDYVVAYQHPQWSVDEPDFQAALGAVFVRLREMPGVEEVRAPLVPGTPLRSADGRTALLVLSLAETDERRALRYHDEVLAVLRDTPLTAMVGGNLAAHATAQEVSRRDLVRAELVALPLVFGLLLWLFRSVVAACVPLVIGFASIEAAMLVLRGLAAVTDVSLFAMNVVTFLGLGLAVDYSLFIVLRFREELHRTGDVDESLRRTTATAGRTVVVSGIAVAASLLGLLWFRIPVLRSIAIGGTSITVVTVLVTVVFLPAILALLGRRIDAGRIGAGRIGRRRAAVAGAQREEDVRNHWYRLALAVMRRPVLVAVAVTAALLVVAAPVRRLAVEPGDARMFPGWTEVRQVADLLEDPQAFAPGELAPVDVVVERDATAAGDPVASLAATLRARPEVTRVDVVPAADGRHAHLRVVHALSPTGDASRALVLALRDTARAQGGVRAWVGGRAAATADIHAEIERAAPWALLTIAAITFVVLLLAFGSVVLPLEALVLNALSVLAAYGALVWVFQDGRLEGLLRYESPGVLEPSVLAVTFAVTFGLSMDYEMFLLSRVREEYLVSGDPRQSVAVGLGRTGRLITGAAAVLVAVVVGFVAGEIVFIKELGVGLGVAVLVDATVVRALLVPAFMGILGHHNWWAPAFLARLADRIGLHAD